MATVVATLRQWFDEAPPEATHLMVVTDEFSWEDFPEYVIAGQDPRKRHVEASDKPMQRVMEVYRLDYSFDKQAAMHRSFTYELPLDGHDDKVLALLGSIPVEAVENIGAIIDHPCAMLLRAELRRRQAYARHEALKATEARYDEERKASRQAALTERMLAQPMDPESLPSPESSPPPAAEESAP